MHAEVLSNIHSEPSICLKPHRRAALLPKTTCSALEAFHHVCRGLTTTSGLLQVYDLQEYRPAPVLRKIWKNFEVQERNGDTWAPIVRG